MKTKIANYSFLRRNLFSDDLLDQKLDSADKDWQNDMPLMSAAHDKSATRNNARKLG